MDLSIRQAGPEDAERLSLVGQATFLESYAGLIDGGALVRDCAERQSVEAYETYLASPGHGLWIAEANQAPVAYAHVCPPTLGFDEWTADDLELKRIYMLDRYQGQGLGRELMRLAEKHARDIGKTRLLIGVHVRNERAIAFYKSLGYEVIAEHPYNVGGVIYDDPILAKTL